MRSVGLVDDEGKISRPCCLALLGAGRAGAFHLTSIFSSGRVLKLKYLVEDDKSRWDDLKRRWPLQNVQFVHSDDLERVVLADEELEACLIATPTPTHEALVRRCLNGGKHVMCEKPLASTLEAVKESYDLAEKCGKILFCAFNRRFDASDEAKSDTSKSSNT